jgi:hypothetical protein
MSIEYNQSLLDSIASGRADINAAKTQVMQYTEMYKAGQISKEEYAEIIKDIQRQINIQASMAELEALSRLNTAINGLVEIASLTL